MATGTKRESGLVRFAKTVEVAGNKLPHPVYLFSYLIIAVCIISMICSMAGVQVTYESAAKQADGTYLVKEASVTITNLLSKSEIANIFQNLVSAYGANVVLLPLLIITFAVSVCEESGFFETALKKSLLGLPRGLTTYVLCVAGICANVMSDVGMVLVPTLGAIIFKALGRNPWIGIATGYAAAAAGFTANLFPGNTDVLISGITNGISTSFGVQISAMSNYYFLATATLIAAGALTFVAETFVTRLFGDLKGGVGDTHELSKYMPTADQNRGLRWAGIGSLVVLAVVLIGAIPKNGFFRNASGKLVPSSPLLSSIPALMFVIFMTLGVCYGFGSKSLTKKDIPLLMQKGVKNMSGLLLILFPASIFVYLFGRSGLSTLMSVLGERFLKSIHLTGFPMLVVFILVVLVLNIFMYSGSAKWMILAPIFVPMFYNLGVSPEITQLAYRIGDSVTNNLTPLNAALLTSVALMSQYRIPELNPEEPGVGTVLSAQFPFSFCFLITFVIWLAVFLFAGIPVGIV